MSAQNSTVPFFVKNCSLAAIATGDRARSLFELRDKLATVDDESIYFHFWGARMNPQFIHTQHHNDFASWAFHRLHDHILAEKLSVIDPTEFDTLGGLRQEILETIEKQLDEYDIVPFIKREDQFHFIRSITVVFNSSMTILQPEDLPKAFGLLSPSSIFYHFIDARGRTLEKMDDFSIWLKSFGDKHLELIESIQSIDPYFLSLTQLKEELLKSVLIYFKNRDKHG